MPIERRNSVFCSLRCEQLYGEMQRRSPPLNGADVPEESPSERMALRHGELDTGRR